MMNATIKFDKRESTIIDGELNRILEACDGTLSVKANMVNLLAAPPLALTRDNADEVAEKIIRGVTRFNQCLDDAAKGEDAAAWLDKYVEEATRELSDEQKYDLMLNLLVTVKALDAQLIEDNLKSEGQDLAAKYSEFHGATLSALRAEVTAGDLDELERLLREALGNTAVLIAGNREIADLLVELQNADAASGFVESNWNDAEFKCYMSLATYIAYSTAQIESIAPDADPELVAVGIAAGIERDKIIKQASLGKITWEVAKKLLKIVGIVAAASLLGAAALYLTVLTFSGAVLIGQIIGGAVAIASGLALGGYLACKAIRCVAETGDEMLPSFSAGCDKVKEKLNKGYQQADGYVRETVCPAAKKSASSAWSFVKEKLNKGIVFMDSKLPQPEAQAAETEEPQLDIGV